MLWPGILIAMTLVVAACDWHADDESSQPDAGTSAADSGSALRDAAQPVGDGGLRDAELGDGGRPPITDPGFPDAGPRVCDGQIHDVDPAPRCSCQALDLGFCISYHDDLGTLRYGECAALGGEEVLATCPEADRIGTCHEIDDCHDPSYIFYSNYAGGFQELPDIAGVMESCQAGEIVGASCAEWIDL